jgi:hypothetical protein
MYLPYASISIIYQTNSIKGNGKTTDGKLQSLEEENTRPGAHHSKNKRRLGS